MRFEDWSYQWPPRPDKSIPKSMLHWYGDRGWSAQVKMNGTCNVLGVTPDRTVRAMSRHNDEHKLWAPSAKTAAIFKSLPGKGWYVFIAELMHSKVSGIRDINYIHDIIIADGEYLVGKTFEERQALLAKLFPVTDLSKSTIAYHVLDENTWLARNHVSGDMEDLYDSLDFDKNPEYEGLVMKSPASKLALCSREKANVNWQVKCRRPHKNYAW